MQMRAPFNNLTLLVASLRTPSTRSQVGSSPQFFSSFIERSRQNTPGRAIPSEREYVRQTLNWCHHQLKLRGTDIVHRLRLERPGYSRVFDNRTFSRVAY